MLKYTVKRLAQSLVTILLIATIVFLLMRCLPTDYYFTEEQLMKFTEEQKYAALEAAGLTDPIGTQLHPLLQRPAAPGLRHFPPHPERCHRGQGHRQKVRRLHAPGPASPPASLWWSACCWAFCRPRFKDKLLRLDRHGLHGFRQRGALPGVLFAGAGLRLQVPGLPHAVLHPECRARPACCPSSACRWLPLQAMPCGPAATWWTS